MACFWTKWKSHKFERQAHYDCKTCLANKWIEKQGRVCFLEEPEQTIYYPTFNTVDDKGNETKPIQATENGKFKYREETGVTVEEVYQWLVEMENLFPQLPALDMLQQYLKPVCVESLIDPMIYRSIALESACEAYGVGALELPVDLFVTFEAVRSSNNLYDMLSSYKTEQEIKQKQK